MKICGVYCFKHTETGRRYIGSSLDVFKRKEIHEAASKRKNPQNFAKQLSFLGIGSFTFEVLECCLPERRFERESFWISFFNSAKAGFNVISEPNNGWDYNFTEDMRLANARGQKASAKAIENVKRMHEANRKNPAHKEHIKNLGKSMLGTKHSSEHKLKISASLKSNPTTAARCRALSIANRGKKYSKERREALSRSMKNSAAAVAQLKELHKLHIGMKRSLSTRKAISEARKRTIESKRKISAEQINKNQTL
jgi:group I intron endonuclease